MKSPILLYLLFLNVYSAAAQSKHGHQWLFENFNTIDFRNDSTIVGQIFPYPRYNTNASFSSNICDKNGNMIMQTGGCYVLNKAFLLMKSGFINTSKTESLGYCLSNETDGYFPIQQNNIFINYPNDSTKFILFNIELDTLPSFTIPLSKYLFYHVIDMTKDNGQGEVVEKLKIAIRDTLSRGNLSAIKHSNNRDWWIIMPKINSDCIFVVPITSNGVGTPQKQCTGFIWKKRIDLGGQVAVAADGTKYARVDDRDTIAVYDFNPSTGQFSDPIRLSHPDNSAYLQGVCFSQNNRFVYVTYRLKVFQYDLQATDIQASMALVGDVSGITPNPDIGPLYVSKLAPDGKIYIASPLSHRFLSVINRPNCKGILCDFRPYAIALRFYNYGALPNNPFFEIPPANYNCDSLSTQTSEIVEHITISPNPAQLKITVSSTYIFETFNVVDLTGKNLRSGVLSSNEHTDIDVSELPNGIYFLQLINQKNHRKALGKFVVNK